MIVANGYHVILDACVLAPMPVCAVLLKLAEEPAMYIPHWSDCILTEVGRALAKPSFSLNSAQVERRLKYMRSKFEEALVTGYEGLIPAMNCHNDDRHVLAAAVRCEADAIVTSNRKDFPLEAVEEFGIEILGVDEFLVHQYTLDGDLVKEKLAELSQVRNWGLDSMLNRLSIVAPDFVKSVSS